MTSQTAASSEQIIQLLEQLSVLNSTFTYSDFVIRMEQVLAALIDSHDFSIAAEENGECRLLHSTRLRGVADRLTPPAVDCAPIVASLEAGGNPALLRVEDQMVPVNDAWRLGAGGQAIGYLMFHDEALKSDDVPQQILEELRRAVSIAFFKITDRRRSEEMLDGYQAKLSAINEVGELLGTLDLSVLLTKLMELSLYVVNGQVGSIVLEKDDVCESCIEWGLPPEMIDCLQTQDGIPVYKRVMETGEPELILNFSASSDYRVEGIDVQVGSYLCVPLIAQNGTLGAINLVNPGEEDASFSELDRDILMTIGGLAATSISNAMLHEDSLEKERYQQSLEIARTIQKNLFPSSAPTFAGFDVAWSSESCDETGGDYVDFMVQDENRLITVVGDVSGHGIGAALLMASARAGLRASLGAGSRDLSEVISALNDQLEQDMELDRFMTMFVTAVDKTTGTLEFVNAGHDSPFLYRASSGEVEEFPSTGMPLGIFAPNNFELGETLSMQPGDVLLITTDGVWEVNGGPDGEMMGKDHLREIFSRHVDEPAEQIAASILADVGEYTEGRPARDDVTIVVIRAIAGDAPAS
ncbi:MAG: GAF domain-containing SpoIIE family protein phosphatase [Planctomycetota bacterium]